MGAAATIEELIAGGGWALRPHGWAAVDGVPAEGWRAYVTARFEATGVPYAFQIDLAHRVTSKSPPDETAFANRIAELPTGTSRAG